MLSKKTRNSLITSEYTTLISEGVVISGEIKFSGCLEIEGTIKGNIITSNDDTTSQVRVKKSGKIIGDSCAPVRVVNGQVTGNIYASSRVELIENAEVKRDIHYQIIEMIEGSQINGSLMFSNKSNENDSNVSELKKEISSDDVS